MNRHGRHLSRDHRHGRKQQPIRRRPERECATWSPTSHTLWHDRGIEALVAVERDVLKRMWDADSHLTRASAAVAVGCTEGDGVDPAIAATRALGANRCRRGADALAVRRRVAAARRVDGFILSDAGDHDLDRITVRIAEAEHVDRNEGSGMRGRGEGLARRIRCLSYATC